MKSRDIEGLARSGTEFALRPETYADVPWLATAQLIGGRWRMKNLLTGESMIVASRDVEGTFRARVQGRREAKRAARMAKIEELQDALVARGLDPGHYEIKPHAVTGLPRLELTPQGVAVLLTILHTREP